MVSIVDCPYCPAKQTLAGSVVVQSQRMAALSPRRTLIPSLLMHPQRTAALSPLQRYEDLSLVSANHAIIDRLSN